MKLLPAFLCIVAIFIAGLFFVHGRGTFQGTKDRTGTTSPGLKKTAALAVPLLMLMVLGTSFMFMGKIAFLIATALIAILMLSFKRK
jgi:hypothetical protein